MLFRAVVAVVATSVVSVVAVSVVAVAVAAVAAVVVAAGCLHLAVRVCFLPTGLYITYAGRAIAYIYYIRKQTAALGPVSRNGKRART